MSADTIKMPFEIILNSDGSWYANQYFGHGMNSPDRFGPYIVEFPVPDEVLREAAKRIVQGKVRQDMNLKGKVVDED